jgi:DNA-directed RNA polymerase specialized sigma24 family protein
MADLLEEPLGTLLARHHRALRKLKALIQRRLGEEAP